MARCSSHAGRDHAGAFGTQASHLDQPPWRLLDHLQGGLTEMVHDPLGHLGADPLDQPRTEVTADPLDRRRQHGVVGLDLELAAILGMARPPAPQAQALPGLGPKQRPDHRQQVTGPVGGHPGHGVARLLVGVGDPLQHRVQGRRRRRPPLLHDGTLLPTPDHVATRPRPRRRALRSAGTRRWKGRWAAGWARQPHRAARPWSGRVSKPSPTACPPRGQHGQPARQRQASGQHAK
jgi:hypothetical protein